METTGLVCDRCKAPLVYEEGSDILRCPHCGYIKKINESDDVSIERIKAKAYKETELGKRKIEAEANIEQQKLHIEEKNIFNKRIMIGLVLRQLFLFLLLLELEYLVCQHELSIAMMCVFQWRHHHIASETMKKQNVCL